MRAEQGRPVERVIQVCKDGIVTATGTLDHYQQVEALQAVGGFCTRLAADLERAREAEQAQERAEADRRRGKKRA